MTSNAGNGPRPTQPTSGEATDDSAKSTRNAPAARVLVAHGNTKRLRSAVDLMREAGFEVIATPDGGDAFARFFEEEPGLVLCSAQLPGLSGVSFAAMIESQAPGTRVAILVDPEEPANLEGAANVPTIIEPLTLAALRAALPDLPERAPAPPVDDGQATYTTSGVFALAALKRFQRDNSLLAVVDEPGLNRIAAMAKHELRMSDEQVIAEGGPGDGFYLVVEGQVRVTLAEKNNQEIARIGAGGFFGEMAMLSDRKRSASVWTVGPTTLLFFGRADFLPLLDDYPTLREVLSGVALKRTEENLWRSLFEDDEVQRSIGSLSEPLKPSTFPAAKAPDPVDETWNTVTPPGGLVVDSRAPGPDLDALRLAHEERIEALEADHALELARVRSAGRWPGVLAGVVVGMVLGFGLGLHLSGDHTSGTVSAITEPTPPPAPAPKAIDEVPLTKIPSKAKARPPEPEPEPELAAVPEGAGPADPSVVEEAPAPRVEVPPPAPVAPPATPEPSMPEGERKRLRRDLFGGVAQNEFAKAIAAGLALEKGGALDWEAEFSLARAQQQGGQSTLALARFGEFIAAHPKNEFVDDAYFHTGEILQARGHAQEAIAAFQQVLARPKSNWLEQAKAHLATLGVASP